jgi:glycosyltransferase involved in cell wall biosynthesis
LRERYSADLASAPVAAFTASLLAHEGAWRLQGLNDWRLAIARNRWFQARAARALDAAVANGDATTVVFAHSYAALEIFRRARTRGWTTVLGQIDPGEAHLQTLREVADRWPEFGPRLPEPPADYFRDWREECRLADRIVVNSEWSRDLLARAGIERSKIHVVALPYQTEGGAAAFERRYPDAFTEARPLRVLFIGSVAAFKGVPSLLESLERLGEAPVEIRMVGPMAATIPARFRNDRRVRWVGAVSRSEVMDYCRSSDVLVFASHSDGFGMAQVEAQAWRLPIIASRSCGRVVQDGVNGLLLDEVSADAIAGALQQVMNLARLKRLSAPPSGGTSLEDFGAALAALVPRD